MKSCIEWRKSFKYLAEVDQFNIDFRNKEIQLIKFLDKYAITQRVNLYMGLDINEDDIKLIIALWETEKYNIAVKFESYYIERHKEYIQEIKDKGIPFYFNDKITSWDRLLAILNFGASDVFIAGELGFDLVRIKSIAGDTNIRCYANVSQYEDESNGFKGFYIRPEDVDLYDEVIDVIEFWKSEDKQNILYEVYFHDKEWAGNLQEIVQGLKLKFNSYYILGSEFANRRMSCNKKCMKGHRCQLCERLVELADSLENSKDFEVFKRRD